MGDRISVSFSITHTYEGGNKALQSSWKQESAILSSHWQGIRLVEMALSFVDTLQEKLQEIKSKGKVNMMNPLDRFEPDSVMFNFIRSIPSDKDDSYDKFAKYGLISSDFRIVKSEDDTDNSDNGHYEIDLSNCLENKKPKVFCYGEEVRVLA